MPFIMTKWCIEFNKTQYHFCLSPSVINVKSFITINETEGFLSHVLYTSHFALNHSFISFLRSTQTHRRAREYFIPICITERTQLHNVNAMCVLTILALVMDWSVGVMCVCDVCVYYEIGNKICNMCGGWGCVIWVKKDENHIADQKQTHTNIHRKKTTHTHLYH